MRHGLRLEPIGELPVVLEQQMRQRNLDLIGGEEATGASVLTVAEAGVLGAGTDEVRVLLLVGAAHVEEAVAVVGGRVLVVVCVPHVGVCGDDLLALAEDEAVGEGYVFLDEAAPGGW